MEKERDEAKEEVQLSQLATVATGDAKVLAEDKLARVQDALAVVEKTRRKAEVEVSYLKVFYWRLARGSKWHAQLL